MITWDLILCQDAFFQFVVSSSSFLTDDPEFLESKRMIMQHHIVISDNLTEAYKSYAKEHGALQSFQFFLDEYAQSTGFAKQRVFIDVFDDPIAGTDIDEAISSAAIDESLKNPLVLCDKCDRCSVFLEEIKPTKTFLSPLLPRVNISNIVRRNTAPFEVTTVMHEPCSLYTSWIAEVFQGEKEISFFDRYMLNRKGFLSFKTHYLPSIAPGTTVKLFIDTTSRSGPYQKEYQERKAELAKLAHKHDIHIIVYDFNHYKHGSYRNSFHDRRIFISKHVLSLTSGIDFLSGNAETIKQSHIGISLKQCNSTAEVKTITCDYPGYQITFDSSDYRY